MSYKIGDILLIKFPFTDLKKSKKRPVLVVKSENKQGDIICFQITSKTTQEKLLEVTSSDLQGEKLKLQSFVKYDKCYTLNSTIVDKKLAEVKNIFLNKVEKLFCEELF